MDSRPPFATGAERLRLLYKLPLTGQESRILVIGSAADADAVFDRGTQRAEIEVVAPAAPMASSAFDVVALPGALTCYGVDDGLRRPPVAPHHLLRLAYAALRPGGTVIGHLDHLQSLHGLKLARNSWRARIVAALAGHRRGVKKATLEVKVEASA